MKVECSSGRERGWMVEFCSRPVCGPSLWRFAGFSRFSGLPVGIGVSQRSREPTSNAQPNQCGRLMGHLFVTGRISVPRASVESPEFDQSDYCRFPRLVRPIRQNLFGSDKENCSFFPTRQLGFMAANKPWSNRSHAPSKSAFVDSIRSVDHRK